MKTTARKIKVLSVFGTRPEAIKMCPLVKELENREEIESVVCVTAQHRQMLDQVLDIFKIMPKHDLNIMSKQQTLSDITTRVLMGTQGVFSSEKPDLILVHGDTTTSFASALAAFYAQIPVGHVEAGLRTFDKHSPFPEEMNRCLTSRIADMHFCPTDNNKENLLAERIPGDIYVTGNTVIDAFSYTIRPEYQFHNLDLRKLDFSDGRYVLLTAHRRENLGKPLESICKALKEICLRFNDVKVIYPVHLNPAVRETVYSILGAQERVFLIEPIDVMDMHNLMSKCYMIMTDSGGLQEEAPSLGAPVLVLRTETERPEAIQAGTVELVGVKYEDILRAASELLENSEKYGAMARARNPYGDGKASARIADAIVARCSNQLAIT